MDLFGSITPCDFLNGISKLDGCHWECIPQFYRLVFQRHRKIGNSHWVFSWWSFWTKGFASFLCQESDARSWRCKMLTSGFLTTPVLPCVHKEINLWHLSPEMPHGSSCSGLGWMATRLEMEHTVGQEICVISPGYPISMVSQLKTCIP